MGVPDDANPLNRRLPAEVVSRRHKPEKRKQEEEEAPLITDQKQVLAMKPEQRVKWLGKALQKGQEGKVTMTTLYDIIAHAKFALGASENVGRKMFKIVRANLVQFSAKQKRFLETESKLAKDFSHRHSSRDGEAADNVAAASSLAAEEDSSEIPGLWARLTKLTPAQCQEAIEELDPSTKELLEDFLEGRVAAKSAAASAPARSRSKSSRSCSSGKDRKKPEKNTKSKDSDKSKRGRSSSESSSRCSRSSQSSSSRRRRRSRSRRGSRGKTRHDKR